MKTPILGSGYVTRSVNAADNRMVNLFPEIIPEGGKEAVFLNRAPGLSLLATVGNGPVRGLWTINNSSGNFLYVVSGSALYKVDTTYNVTNLGVVGGNGPVSMTDNGTQLFIACNGPSYTYDTGSQTFGQITDINFLGAGSVDYLDGYFVVNNPGTTNIQVSSILNKSPWDATKVASAQASGGNVVGIAVIHRELWVFKPKTIEVWYDAGTLGFPLSPISGAFSETGCVSAASIAKLDNSLFWLGQDARGQGVVYRSNGYTGQRISTHAVEWQIQQYGNLSGTIGYTYQREGHSFYVLIFPSANTSWVYDVATEAWHERAGFDGINFTRHRSNCHSFFNGQNVVGDYQTGNIYALDLSTFSDNGSPQRWLRSWRALPPDQNDLTLSSHHSLQLDCESGVGLTTGQGNSPQVMLRWSDDGGHTWSNEMWASMGNQGQYGQRVIWRRLGMTRKLRDRVYEISGTDPVKIVILGAELKLSGTDA